MTHRTAYLPLFTYPEALPDAAVTAALAQAKTLHLAVETTVFAVDVPQPVTSFGSFVLDVPDLIRRAEAKSRAEAERLTRLVAEGAPVATATVHAGALETVALREARLRDVVLLPWPGDGVGVPGAGMGTTRDMAAAMVFGAGRPVLMVPEGTEARALDHLAVAWDGSRVAARALRDGLGLLRAGGRVSVLAVVDDGAQATLAEAEALAAQLRREGWKAQAVSLQAGDGSVAVALQDGARNAGAQVLAVGGFGHSRLRDFVLGGVTRDILTRVTLPVLLSH